jgi:hypothetical protein
LAGARALKSCGVFEAMEWIEMLAQLVVTALQANPDVLDIGLVPLAVVLLVWRSSTSGGRHGSSLLMVLLITIVRIVGTLLIMVLGLLLALGRSAGRPYRHW